MTAGIHEVEKSDVASSADGAAQSTTQKAPSAAEALEQVTEIVRKRAAEIAVAAVNAAVSGQLSQVKYLFELAGIDRGARGAGVQVPEEESLTARLLRELGMPTKPENREAYDGNSLTSRKTGDRGERLCE